MKTIHKYKIRTIDEQTIQMPVDAQILHVDEVSGTLYLWAKVNPQNKMEDVKVSIYGTGMEMDDTTILRHIGSIIVRAGFVWHVFVHVP